MPRHLVEAVEVTESQIHLIRLKGIFDASTVNEFEKVVSYLLTRNFFCMVVDLSAVEFISSAGWGAFTGELRRVRENNGDIKLAGMSADLFDVFLLLELDRFINAYETADEAILAFLQPPPEPVVEEPFEVPMALRERFGAPTVKESIASEAPAVYGLASPALLTVSNESHREKYDRSDEVYLPEPQSTTFNPRNDDYWTPRPDFDADDPLKIEPEQRRLGSGRERRERLLTSGPATIEYAKVPRILPPPAVPPSENQNHHTDADQFAAPQYDINDAGSEPEFNFYESAAALDEPEEPIASANSMDSLTTSNLHAFSHEPLTEKTQENSEIFSLSRNPDRDLNNPRPRKFSWQEAEAFSELSLDLESHLQAHGRYEEAEADFNAFEEFHDETPNPLPATSERREEAPKFNTIVFSPDEVLPEDDGDEAVNFEAPYSPIADLRPASEAIVPILGNEDTAFSDDSADFGREQTDFKNTQTNFMNDPVDEAMDAPLFNDYASTFHLKPNWTGQRMTPEHDEDFETQDIRDPWILEEIDTLPEEYEMDDAAAVYDDQPIAREEFSTFDFANEPEMALTPAVEVAPKHEETLWTNAAATEVLAAPNLAVNEAASYEMSVTPNLEISNNTVDVTITNDAVNTASIIDATVDDAATDAAHNSDDVLILPEARELNLEAEALPATVDVEAVPKIPMSGDLAEMIRGIIAAYPHYGPTMICKFLEERVEPPVYLSRSTIYRYLREANLSTRRQRLEYAGEEFRLTDETAYDA